MTSIKKNVGKQLQVEAWIVEIACSVPGVSVVEDIMFILFTDSSASLEKHNQKKGVTVYPGYFLYKT